MTECCGNCRFAYRPPDLAEQLEAINSTLCRRYPPPAPVKQGSMIASGLGKQDPNHIVWPFPQMDTDQWCGEYLPREAQEGPADA